MKNFKHSLIAVIAVAMISSLAVAQASGLNNSKTEREQRINAAAAEQNINFCGKYSRRKRNCSKEFLPSWLCTYLKRFT